MIRIYIFILSLLLLYSCGKDPYAIGNLTEYDSSGNLLSRGDTTQWQTSNDPNDAKRLFSDDVFNLTSLFKGRGLPTKFCDRASFKVEAYPNPVHKGDLLTIRVTPPLGKRVAFMVLTIKSDIKNLEAVSYRSMKDSIAFFPFGTGGIQTFFLHGSDDFIYDIVTTDTCSYVGHGYVKIIP